MATQNQAIDWLTWPYHYADNRISYIEPSACTSKEQEVRSKSKEDKRISIVDGALRIKNPANKLEADLGSDLLVKYALTRRGLALDQANVVAFRLHDAWVERLMEVRHTAPPAGYIAVSHQQILNADGKLFVKLAEATRSGVQLQASGRPIDNVWRATCATILMWRISCNHFLNLLLRGQILTHKFIHVEEAKESRKVVSAQDSPVCLLHCEIMALRLLHRGMLCVLDIH